MPLEKSSLILVDYTARVKDTNDIFDTTREEEAKKTNFYDPTHNYEPKIVSVGESWVLKGLDEALSNANVGDKINIEVPPEKAFGKREELGWQKRVVDRALARGKNYGHCFCLLAG